MTRRHYVKPQEGWGNPRPALVVYTAAQLLYVTHVTLQEDQMKRIMLSGTLVACTAAVPMDTPMRRVEVLPAPDVEPAFP